LGRTAKKKTKPNVQPLEERRRYPRLPNPDLIIKIDGKLLKIIDVSAAGLRVENKFTADGLMTFVIYPCQGSKLDLNRGLYLSGLVLRVEDSGVGIKLQPTTLALAKLLAGS